MNKSVRIENAKGQIFDAIQIGEVYTKDMAKHFGNTSPMIMSFVKVRRFIKSQNAFAANATEYPAASVVADTWPEAQRDSHTYKKNGQL